MTPEQKRQFKLPAQSFAAAITEVDPLAESLKLHTLKTGDVITAINGVTASKFTQLPELHIKLSVRAGETVTAQLLREGQSLALPVKTHRQYFRKQRTDE